MAVRSTEKGNQYTIRRNTLFVLSIGPHDPVRRAGHPARGCGTRWRAPWRMRRPPPGQARGRPLVRHRRAGSAPRGVSGAAGGAQAHRPCAVITCARRTVYSAGLDAGRTRLQVKQSKSIPFPLLSPAAAGETPSP